MLSAVLCLVRCISNVYIWLHTCTHMLTQTHLLLHVLISSHSTCTHMHMYVHALACSHPKVTYTPINLHYHRLKHTHTHPQSERQRERCSCIYKHTLHYLSHIIIYLRPLIASYIDIPTLTHGHSWAHTVLSDTITQLYTHTNTQRHTHTCTHILNRFTGCIHTL